MKYAKIILLIIIMVGFLPQNSLNGDREQVMSKSVELIYRGALFLDISGEDKVKEYINESIASCEAPVDHVSITLYFDVYVTALFDLIGASVTVENTSIKIEDLRITPNCAHIALNYLVNNFNSRSNSGRIPLELTIINDSLVLLEPSFPGEVVGVVRFNYDLVYVVGVYSYEDAVTVKYARYDLYYEPLTNIPAHFSVSRVEKSIKGSLNYILYVTLFNDPTVFKNIHRKVFEIKYLESGENKTATLIVLYYPLNDSAVLTEPSITLNQDNISLFFNESALCFIQLGVVSGNVTSNLQMNSYNTTNGVIYFSVKPDICKSVNIVMSTSVSSDVKEQKDYPEKGLPPSLPVETMGDVIVAITVFVPLFILVYWLFKIIVNRIVYS